VTKARASIETGSAEETAAGVARALEELDRAASKGVVHPNNAARRKSRLMKRLNTLQAEEDDEK